jgi:hypothetical protein
MDELFGIDIAAEIGDALGGQLRPAVLTKVVAGARSPGNLTGGTNPTPTPYECEGFMDTRTAQYRGGTLVRQAGKYASLLGLPLRAHGVEPEAGDLVSIDGGPEFRVLEVEADPAKALFECMVEGA